MSLAAGALSKVSVGSTTDSLSSAVATGGTGPYTYQWYRSLVSGFVPGPSNLISGATSLVLNDSQLQPGTAYFYKVVATDSVLATATSSQLEVDTVPEQAPNQFAESPQLGMLDLRFNPDTVSVQIDASETGILLAGQAVKIVDSADGVPKVVACTADSDPVMGFLNYSIKDRQFVAGSPAEISMDQNVMYLVSTGAIARGDRVCLDLTYPAGGVQDISSASSGDSIVGWAYDKATAAGQLVRIKLQTPSFLVKP